MTAKLSRACVCEQLLSLVNNDKTNSSSRLIIESVKSLMSVVSKCV